MLKFMSNPFAWMLCAVTLPWGPALAADDAARAACRAFSAQDQCATVPEKCLWIEDECHALAAPVVTAPRSGPTREEVSAALSSLTDLLSRIERKISDYDSAQAVGGDNPENDRLAYQQLVKIADDLRTVSANLDDAEKRFENEVFPTLQTDVCSRLSTLVEEVRGARAAASFARVGVLLLENFQDHEGVILSIRRTLQCGP